MYRAQEMSMVAKNAQQTPYYSSYLDVVARVSWNLWRLGKSAATASADPRIAQQQQQRSTLPMNAILVTVVAPPQHLRTLFFISPPPAAENLCIFGESQTQQDSYGVEGIPQQ